MSAILGAAHDLALQDPSLAVNLDQSQQGE
jgi:hypothetical protein